MKYLIFALIFFIAFAFSMFSSYMFFIPYEVFSFLILTIVLISNKQYFNPYRTNQFYIAAFLIGFIMDCMQHNIVFYNAFVFVLIVYLNDFIKSISGSKFIIGLILLIGIYDNLVYNIPIAICMLNILLLFTFYYIVQRLLSIAYAKKDWYSSIKKF